MSNKALLRGVLCSGPAIIGAVLLLMPLSARADGKREQVYMAACAACHGARGTGVEQTRLGFDVPVPDFTDCSFATREPNADWFAVVHDGGPVRAFSRLMPAFGDALSDEEIELALDYIRSWCNSREWPRGELNFPRPLVTEKAYPEDEAVITLGFTAEGDAAVSNKFVYEKRLGSRNQVEFIVPFGWREQLPLDAQLSGAGRWIGGLGDVAAGVKRTLFQDLDRGSIFSLAGELVFPTGDSRKGFGKGTTVFEPFVAYGQILPSEFFIHSQAGAEFPFDTDRARREAFWRMALGRTFESSRFGRAWSPMVELLGGREFETGARNNWDVLPQMQVTLNKRQHIMINLGVRIPLTERGPRKTEVLFYLLWDWFDGGFAEGW